MKADPCSVCGGTDVNLVDGYYYCVECGTQDENVRETVVEQTVADGTYMRTFSKKVTKAKTADMSEEWYKWHTFNFILTGLADELIELGAKPSFKVKLLWIWSRYVKMYQNKEEDQYKSCLFNQNQKDSDLEQSITDADISDEVSRGKKSFHFADAFDIEYVTLSVLQAMLCAALNLDNSDIQVADVVRFVREQKLSSIDCHKFVPNELTSGRFAYKKNFSISMSNNLSAFTLRFITMTLFRRLEIGTPNVPDMKKIVDRFVTELCLPDDFRNLVYSLMLETPFMSIFSRTDQKLKIPNYECVAMTYIVVALKICFGLDDEYETRLSNAVEKVNENNNYSKSYKFDMFLDDTNRLFSFREWANFLNFRKMILSSFYFSYTLQYGDDFDDYAFMVQTKDRYKEDVAENVSDHVTMDILHKISASNEYENCKINYPPTLTPLSTYTDIIAANIKDPDLRLLLCEDFTKYSLKYSTVDFRLLENSKNIFIGVNEVNKIQLEEMVCDFLLHRDDKGMVYVRNCDNKNWLITKPPKVEHITKDSEDDDINDKVSDHGAIFNQETADMKNFDMKEEKEARESYDLPEENLEINIFDDNFADVDDTYYSEQLTGKVIIKTEEEIPEIDIKDLPCDSDKSSFNMSSSNDLPYYDPISFCRDEAIKQLVTSACKKYKISIPKQYQQHSERKRKLKNSNTNEAIEVKRRKINNDERSNTKLEIAKLIEKYRSKVHIDNFEKQLINNLYNSDIQINTDCQSINESDVNNSTQDEISAINLTENATRINHDLTDNVMQENITIQNDTDSEIQDTVNDPKFDEKVYDVNQLYIKFKEAHLDEISFKVDPDLDHILTQEDTNTSPLLEDVRIQSDTHSDTDTKEIEKPTNKNKNTKPLFVSNKEIKDYGYWTRHYIVNLGRNRLCRNQFQLEMLNNFPKSFSFIFSICANICESSTLELYQSVMKLEKVLYV